jgi:hypothetical protein
VEGAAGRGAGKIQGCVEGGVGEVQEGASGSASKEAPPQAGRDVEFVVIVIIEFIVKRRPSTEEEQQEVGEEGGSGEVTEEGGFGEVSEEGRKEGKVEEVIIEKVSIGQFDDGEFESGVVA